MPIYEYICSSCDSKFELLRPLSCAGQSASCPKCHTEARRVFSPFIAFNKFSDVDGGHEPIAGATSSCAGCAAGSCSTCH